MRWILLLRAVNLGPNNKIAMKDLKTLLEGLGHTEVKTYLNSGNATFESSQRSAGKLAADVEDELRRKLNLDVRCCVRKDPDVRKALDGLPDLPGYVAITVLFDKPTPTALRAFLAMDWSPEVVKGNDQVIYIGFQNAAKTKLTHAKIEKALGVSATARTPNTLRKLLDSKP
ncbi:MAG: hypothetical protein QOJ79_2559 [Actinomycetota bacterium]|jgi:uncharacterized protein (DUF1697 family)|nr:hypothetical protein [Actinomycetota bacterium]